MKTSKKNSKQKVKKSVKVLSRKELRKQKCAKKKENKRRFFSGKLKNTIGAEIINKSQQPNVDDGELKKEKTNKNLEKNKLNSRPDAVENRRKELARQKELQNSSRKQRHKQLKLDNEEEERKIVYLEKKLRLNKSKDKKKSIKKIFDDGLDYVLEFCESDDETNTSDKKTKEKENDIDLEAEYSNSESEMLDSDKDDILTDDEKSSTQEYSEDIYGRKRDKNGEIIEESLLDNSSKYIPPHQRVSNPETNNKNVALQRLLRYCKGHLNRLSEQNLHKIANAIEKLYMENSRNDMNNILTELLKEALICQTMSNERMVQEHMVLLAYLHAHIGNEIGAHFLQVFVRYFEELVQKIHEIQIEDKKINNLVLALSYMYIFKMYEHGLLIEMITRLADNLCEKAIECMLIIYQTIGFKLRKDDPLAFKQMLTIVQKKNCQFTNGN